MRRLAVVGLLWLAPAVCGQTVTTARKTHFGEPGGGKPECGHDAICFSGEVRDGGEFRRALNQNLEFVLRLPGGFDVVSRGGESSCKLSSWVVNPPIHAHNQIEIDAGYTWTAEQEVETSTREFRFVRNCREYQYFLDLLYGRSELSAGQYLNAVQKLDARGRLWITGSKATHSRDSMAPGNGTIEWLKFSVEIKTGKP